mmetsp:Transcript_49635/g.137947  ORF Transcript_49635/g.137947 Transcript_49635/m.137947 type:complete len:729 (-) Transcript_49635:85-2271(-)
MAALRFTLLCLGVAVPAHSARLSGPGSSITADMRPIRKVITLLEEMKVQVEKEAKEDLLAYDKYMCWCATNRKEKTAAVEVAEERIDGLTAFLEEASAKAGALKTEIAGLAAEIAEDQDALATATSVREEELKAFLAEEADMKETLSLIGQAIDILTKVQLLQKHGQSSDKESQEVSTALVQVRNIIQQRFPKFQERMQRDLFDMLGSLPETAQEQHHLRREGAAFQQAELLPWEKTVEQVGQEAKPNTLTGLASGAKSYNSRSGSILGVLAEMKDEFARDLFSAQKMDFQAEVAFQKLRAAKLAEIAAATKSEGMKETELSDTLDKAAKAKEEKESTEEAMAADQAFLATLEKNCKAEDEEYKARFAVRTEEIRALGEALKILTDDSARDLYAKTMSLVQLSSAAAGRTAAQDRIVQHAARRIAEVARRSKNWSLASLAVRMQLDTFTKVKEVMDKMLVELQKQQREEYSKWELCKKDIDLTEDEIKEGTSLKEDLAEKHLALSNEIATLTEEIAALKKDVADMEVSLKEAGEERKAQNALFQTSVSDQRATVNILEKATERLRAFYVFGQIGAYARKQEPGAAAPPPPPSPKAYEKSALSGGVLQLLDKIIKDAEVAEQELVTTEQKAQSDYAAFVQSATASIEADRDATRQKEAGKASAEAELSETEEAQLANGEDLAKLADLLKAHHMDCDYLLKYFDVRQKARAEEMDAITDAKATLSGSKFE